MKLAVHLFATLARHLPETATGNRATVEVPEGSTVGQVVSVLGIPDGTPVIMLVNGREASPEQRLEDGDVLTLFPPLAGGR